MLHLLSLHYTVPEQAAEPFIPGHVAYLERHHQDGTFLVSGQTVPTSIGGVIIAGTASAASEAARSPSEYC